MQKLSVLLCTCNNARDAIDHIKDLYGIADDFTVIEQSRPKEKRWFKTQVIRQKLDKVRVFDAVALGFQEPLRMYGLSKCRHEWVLHMDVDERLTRELKEAIPGMINGAGCSAFAIRRYEEVRGDDRGKFFTWQIRLYKKSRVLYKGILHESPVVRGKVIRVAEDEYYIKHEIELMDHMYGYGKIHMIDQRLSYRLYNQKIEEYITKQFTVGEHAKKSILGRVLLGILVGYEKLSFRKQEQEISNFDYWMFSLIRGFGYIFFQKDIYRIPRAFKAAWIESTNLKAWKKAENGDIDFEISKEINRIGITKFLRLEKESTIRRLLKEYSSKPQGIDLLIRLLRERYKWGKLRRAL